MKRITQALIALALTLCLTATGFAASLKMGSTGDDVYALQLRLIELGLLEGAADGDYGQMTANAVSEFQSYLSTKGYDVNVDGVAGEQTLSLIYDPNKIANLFDLAIGDKGTPVKKLQQRLIDLGFLGGSADGHFGEMTKTALTSLQAQLAEHGAEGIAATGVLDEATRSIIFNNLSAYGFVTPEDYDSSDPLSLKSGHIYAIACILMDADTGETLFEKLPDAKMYPASTTKILTLALALENLSLDANIEIPEAANDVPLDSSRVPVLIGEKMSVSDLLYGLMIRSGNDAANAIAALISGDNEKFAVLMNAKAQALGMNASHFVNPHGYHDDEHYTTARDMAVLTCSLIKNDKFREIVTRSSYTMAPTNKRGSLMIARNYLVTNSTSGFYYPNAFGIKTGFTSKAGYCYVGGCERDGHTLIAVVFHSGKKNTNKWTDVKRMYAYGFTKLGIGESQDQHSVAE